MKRSLLITLLAIMLIASSLAIGGQFLGAPLQAYAYSGGSTYTYEYNGEVYESDVSEDDAWANAMRDQVEQGNLTMEEVIEVEYATFGSRDIIEIPSLFTPYSGGRAFTGHAEWQPSSSAAYLPLQRVKVELYMHWGSFLPLKIDESYTDDNGNYIFNNHSAWAEIATIGFGTVWTAVYQTYSVRIYPESETFRVGRDWVGIELLDMFADWTLGVIPNFLAYYVSSSTGTWAWESSGSFGTMQIPYTTANDTNKSFYISQAMVMGQRFAKNARGTSINTFVTAIYPFGDINSAFC